MIDTEEPLEQPLVDTAQERRQGLVGDGLVIPIEQGVLAPLAPITEQFMAVGVTQACTDAQLGVGVQKGVWGPLRDAVEQRLQGAQGRALPGLVEAENDMQTLNARH